MVETEPGFISSAGVRFRRAFDYTAMGFCIAFNTFLLIWGLVGVVTSIWSLLDDSYIGSVLSIFLTLLFNLLMLATSMYGFRALRSKDLSKQIRYILVAVILVILYSILLASQSTEYIAAQAIDRNGANAYDNQTDSSEYELLHDYRTSFYSTWRALDCSGGYCLVEGCLGDPVRFTPVMCTSDASTGEKITADGLKYNRSRDYFLQCVTDQPKEPNQNQGMINSLCYTRESAISSSGHSSLRVIIILSVAIGSMILAVISVITLVSRPRTWQDDDFHFVSDKEMFPKIPTAEASEPSQVE
ncbi:hypothetical protein Pmar_PMAR006516 [Perkinsus marinus ATCC 50983]|uniref:Uncharacterized protein n=1 Tax=Perkinsus marinus (strain ATCC 50983 / TXsc) TaxID=423536 RepID=C5K9X0_PERM5|nr:hypothetical protein Pmar_PMAR006516 [Perkinsus marinus ATCC 50983]EER18892.1 hypothetical protein Pmar_PMAR006516 [Perkinsus marinus ATCC 50983]|eukprot:XP_002787096.1 hypothetical protein Pmar_PMAR006516 [Perkinsus marinus ATCC 50983]